MARKLIQDLMDRRHYKRLMEWSLGDLPHAKRTALRDRFRTSRAGMQSAVQQMLVRGLQTSIQSQMKTRESLVTDRSLERLRELASQRVIVLIDLPLRGWFAAGEAPIFVPDIRRRYFRASLGRSTQGTRTLWSEQWHQMMERIAYFRIFCEPEVHSLLLRVMTIDGIREAIVEALPELDGS